MDEQKKVLCNKMAGGRGFQDLHQFNIAILGRMVWRLSVEPDDLVCLLLRAKYCPNRDFLDAKPGENLSYIWTSILVSHDLIRKGHRWKG